ncbi:uncharacterized protein E0L32_001364 [Thyridium curvatum]|uniref:Uncharacterized protein n=1 Tax=Thyridium curvatum TaxID=1093900 RepID=A0A507ARS9_9PEZI|nr:uncharacterized protein E0L32_001364 [Thyridium curvatum]TPX10167.1 hypothetical protein E0L32_001364 [Thyridium curvatum]
MSDSQSQGGPGGGQGQGQGRNAAPSQDPQGGPSGGDQVRPLWSQIASRPSQAQGGGLQASRHAGGGASQAGPSQGGQARQSYPQAADGPSQGGFQGGESSGLQSSRHSQAGRGTPRGGNRRGRGNPPRNSSGWGPRAQNSSRGPDITKLENDIVTSLNKDTKAMATQMGQMSLGGSIAVDHRRLPQRPSFGTRGAAVVIRANYFDLRLNIPQKLYQCNLEAGYADQTGKEVKGKLLQKVISAALATLQIECPFATEFKNLVISLEEFEVPSDRIVRCHLPPLDPDSTASQGPEFMVRVSPFQQLDPHDLTEWLQDMRENSEGFPKYHDIISAMDIIMGHALRQSTDVAAVGRSRFFPLVQHQGPKEGRLLSNGSKLIMRGFFQSVRPATGRLLLNVNVTHGIFRPSGPLSAQLKGLALNKMKGYEANTYDTRQKLSQFSKTISKARVLCDLFDVQGRPKRVEKTIIGLAVKGDGNKREPTKPPRFVHQYGGPHRVSFYMSADSSQGLKLSRDGYISVADYFMQRYQLETDASLPVVNVGTTSNPIYIPAERCTILGGQSLRGTLSGTDSAEMIRFACRAPQPNEKSILQEGRALLKLDDNPLLDAFGVEIGPNLVTVQARVLPIPQIDMAGGSPLTPSNASWNFTGRKVAQAGRTINKVVWFLVKRNGDVRESELNGLKAQINEWLKFWQQRMGIAISTQAQNTVAGYPLSVYDGSIMQDVHNGMDQKLKGLGTFSMPGPLAILIVPDRDTELYRAIKTFGDVKLGIHTLCVTKQKFDKGKSDQSITTNIGLKVNLKVGGINHRLKHDFAMVKNKSTMFVGYDVIHPTNLPMNAKGPGTADLKSQVGLVISLDADLAQWPAIAWNQAGGVEMLGDALVDKFASRLDLWSRHNGNKLPENIVIFRDGVSESQFEQVIDKELPSIRKAYAKEVAQRGLKPEKTARISIIVSVKRHQTRFYPTGEVTGKNTNIKPATVVDRGVTTARYWEFFLTAHAAVQGTARPARYTVIYDEIFKADHGNGAANYVEKLTHDMCYAYNRATKAVSICPPAYFADLVCTRARLHNQDQLEAAAAGSASVDIMVNKRLADSMYYI